MWVRERGILRKDLYDSRSEKGEVKPSQPSFFKSLSLPFFTPAFQVPVPSSSFSGAPTQRPKNQSVSDRPDM